MKEYYIKSYFLNDKIECNLRKLVQNDYNSAKIIFESDVDYDSAFLEIKDELDNEYVLEIKNNQVIIGPEVLKNAGKYTIEVSIFKDESKLTNYKMIEFNVREELVNDKKHVHEFTEEIKYTSNNDGTHSISAKKVCACGYSEDVELEKTIEDCTYSTEINEEKNKITYTCEHCKYSYTKDYHEQEHIHNWATISDDGQSDDYCHVYHQKCSGCNEENIEYVKHTTWQLISNDGRWASIRCMYCNYDLEIRSSAIKDYIPDYNG